VARQEEKYDTVFYVEKKARIGDKKLGQPKTDKKKKIGNNRVHGGRGTKKVSQAGKLF